MEICETMIVMWSYVDRQIRSRTGMASNSLLRKVGFRLLMKAREIYKRATKVVYFLKSDLYIRKSILDQSYYSYIHSENSISYTLCNTNWPFLPLGSLQLLEPPHPQRPAVSRHSLVIATSRLI